MSDVVTCYPVRVKAKSVQICEAFAQGCGGIVSLDNQVRAGPAFFYGVDASNEAVWQAVKSGKLPYYYCDNSYFDEARQVYFRITKNALQHSGIGMSFGGRFAEIQKKYGVEINDWSYDGEHIVICPQSGHFMRTIADVQADWLDSTERKLRAITSRQLRVREWNGNKSKLAQSLPLDLDGAHALVTWSSAAAVTAVLAGVPVIVEAECAASPMSGTFDKLENLPKPERENWANVLADNQWTLEEMRDGTAWRTLQGSAA